MTFDVKRWKTQMAMREVRRDEVRKQSARDRHRLFKLHSIGATTSDEARRLFPSSYPQKLD